MYQMSQYGNNSVYSSGPSSSYASKPAMFQSFATAVNYQISRNSAEIPQYTPGGI